MGRIVVVVDEDIDPSNINDVMWATATRSKPRVLGHHQKWMEFDLGSADSRRGQGARHHLAFQTDHQRLPSIFLDQPIPSNDCIRKSPRRGPLRTDGWTLFSANAVERPRLNRGHVYRNCAPYCWATHTRYGLNCWAMRIELEDSATRCLRNFEITGIASARLPANKRSLMRRNSGASAFRTASP